MQSMFTHFTALETNEQVELNKKILVLHSQQLTIELKLWESLLFAFTFLAYLSLRSQVSYSHQNLSIVDVVFENTYHILASS